MESEDDDELNSFDIKKSENYALPFFDFLEENIDNSSKLSKKLNKGISEIYSDNDLFILSSEYHYKTEPYYQIVLRENQNGYKITPSSNKVLDAYVVPICLTMAKIAGIPVLEWGVSDSQCPLPSIIYGINYYSDSSKFEVVEDLNFSKVAVKKVTHSGKYPFCFQKIPSNYEIKTFTTLFGKNDTENPEVSAILKKIYEVFEIPVAKIILVYCEEKYYLSSISPIDFSRVSSEEEGVFKAMAKIGMKNGKIRNFCR